MPGWAGQSQRGSGEDRPVPAGDTAQEGQGSALPRILISLYVFFSHRSMHLTNPPEVPGIFTQVVQAAK